MPYQKPFLWMHDKDWVIRAIFWSWVVIGSTVSLGVIVVGCLGMAVGLYGIGLFFIGLGAFLGYNCYAGAKDDWVI